ncbi:transmembrane protein Tmp5 [Agrilactobacillus composti DSM 18527 = JCM 14202]|nr:transmembrane protein Tmp5 [Agrilactobacillus composti DSM 18527 = JCM 14202]
MSYLVVNHFNLMWLDSVIMLPIVALSINGIFKGHYPLFWPIALGITILLNYYIGFMIVLFAILYFIFQCSLKITKPKQLLPAIWRFVSGGLLAAGTAAWLLLPTLSA